MKSKFLLRLKNLWILPVLFLMFMTMSMVGMAQTVTVSTDLDDYYPGQWVIITGSGWQNDAEVQLTLTHLDPLPDPLHAHESWLVQPNAEGYIYYEWFVEDQELGTSFQLDALGLTTALKATTYFTDAISLTPFTIGTQTGTLTAGTIGTSTYSCSVTASGNPQGVTVNLAVSGLPSGVTFTPNNFVAAKNTTTTFTLSLTTGTATPPGTYSFTITASGTDVTTTSQTGTLTIGCTTPPNNVSNGFKGGTICSGDNGTLTFDANNTGFAGSYTIVYSNGTTQWSQIINTADETTFNVAVNPATTTTYTLVSITNTSGCIRTTDFGDATAEITVRTLPAATLTTNNINFCQGDPITLTITLTGTGTISGVLSDGSTFSGTAGTINKVLFPTETTTYTVTSVTNSTCTGTASGTTSATLLGKYTADAGADQTICPQGIATISGSVTGSPTTILWTTSGTGGFASAGSLSTAYTPSVADITAGSVILSLTASGTGACDGSDNLVLTIQDITNPEITDVADVTVNCQDDNTSVATGVATGTDNCSPVTITQTETSTKGTDPLLASFYNYVITRTWKATDVTGNFSTSVQLINVQDITAPTAVCQSISVNLDAFGNASITPAQINNGSSDICSPVILVSVVPSSFTCSNVGPNIVTLKIKDVTGNISSCQSTVTIKDVTPPVITCVPNTSKYVDSYQTYYTVSVGEFDATATDVCGIQSPTYACATASITSGNSLAGVQLNVGTHTIVWTAIDVNNNSSTCTTVVTVNKRGTTLTYNGDVTEQYSDVANLSATLLDISGGLPGVGVSGKTISFKIGNQLGVTGTTDANGVATAALKITQAPGSYTVSSSFAGDGSYEPSNDADGFVITKEDARVEFTGTQIVATASATSGLAIVTLRATVQDITAVIEDAAYDAFDGDIRNAKVRFIKDGLPLTSSWLTPTLVNSSDLKTGVVSYEWAVNIGTATDENYTIGIEVGNDGYYTRYDQADNTVVTVYKPTGDFITGGGYLINPTNTAGTYAGDPGLKTNFGYNVKYNKKGTNLQGNMNFIFRRTVGGIVHTYQIKSNAMTSLGVNINNTSSKKAVFVSKSNLTDITNPLAPVSLGGNLNLQVNMTDKGEPGIYSDMIAISLWNGSTLLFSSNWSGSNTAEKIIDGGNLVVHSGFNVGATLKIASITTDIAPVVTFEPTLKAYPNPFTERLNIEFSSATDTQAKLEIYSITGAKLETLFNGPVFGGLLYNFEYLPRLVSSQMVFYHLTIDGKTQVGKVIYNERR